MKSNKELKSELNSIRANQKKITDFNSVADWIKYSKGIAIAKAEILNNLEQNAKDGIIN